MSYHNYDQVKKIKRICPFCQGTGQDPTAYGFSKCPTGCESGSNLIPDNWVECSDCRGKGRMPMHSSLPLGGIGILGPAFKLCPTCGGKGYRLPNQSTIVIKSSEKTELTNEKKILDFLTNNSQKSYDDDQLGELLNINRHQVNKICNELKEKGKIIRYDKLHNRII